jgi:hypothetical protein
MPRNISCAAILTTAMCLSAPLSGAADGFVPRAEAGEQVVSVAAIVPKSGIGTFARVFDCTGSIMHQSDIGEIDSPLTFWLGVRDDRSVHGMVTYMDASLDLPPAALTGRLDPRHDDDGLFVGGRMVLDWPFADQRRTVELSLVRESNIRVGPKLNGADMVKRRTSPRTYAADAVQFDRESHPKLGASDPASFVSATCAPTDRLSLVADHG